MNLIDFDYDFDLPLVPRGFPKRTEQVRRFRQEDKLVETLHRRPDGIVEDTSERTSVDTHGNRTITKTSKLIGKDGNVIEENTNITREPVENVGGERAGEGQNVELFLLKGGARNRKSHGRKSRARGRKTKKAKSAKSAKKAKKSRTKRRSASHSRR